MILPFSRRVCLLSIRLYQMVDGRKVENDEDGSFLSQRARDAQSCGFERGVRDVVTAMSLYELLLPVPGTFFSEHLGRALGVSTCRTFWTARCYCIAPVEKACLSLIKST
jgi:hypothetical protein